MPISLLPLITDTKPKSEKTTIGWNLRVRKTATYSGILSFKIVLLFLLLSKLCYLAGDFEGCSCASGVGYGDFGFTGAAVADGNRKGGAVCVAGGIFFDHINLDGMEGEDLQGEEDLMAAGYCFFVVGIDKLPLICGFTGELFSRKGKFIDALSKRFRWQRCRGGGCASAQYQKKGNAYANKFLHCYPPISVFPRLITVLPRCFASSANL